MYFLLTVGFAGLLWLATTTRSKKPASSNRVGRGNQAPTRCGTRPGWKTSPAIHSTGLLIGM
ncbi:hypothetical protein [Larkinella knui]|uniref:Uncharacterized protein n=1 Tax=Larkinella knui TaxID=2025310 RepID=A0A3P1CR08_9BACT|nr:hypothetical protein [Larkinella knui]RRB15404.1 hypothetical protein EHT87_12810 [Larkinella knui]